MGARPARNIQRILALVLAATFLFAVVPVYADTPPAPLPPAPAPPEPAPEPKPEPAPAPSKPKAAPAPSKPKSDSSKPSTQQRQPAETPSALGDTGVDPATEAFRAELAAKQAELDAFMAQLDELDRELALATESYNQAAERLGSMRRRVNVAEDDVIQAQTAYEMQEDVLRTRAQSLYRDGTFAAVEVLLGAESVPELLARFQFLNTIGMRDADIAASLRGQKDLVEQQLSDLKNAERQAEALEFELRARQIEIMLRIQERQEMMAAAQGDLVALLDEEAQRRSQQEAKLLKEILTGASQVGVDVEPGSPVETALAYHGIPYLWGGETPAGFDCSGLLLYVYRQHGVALPHYSGSQFLLGDKIAPADLLPGDAVFFGSPIHHVGMYIGGGYFLHAPRTGDFVKISWLAERSDYAGARRYPWQPRVGPPLGVAFEDPAAALAVQD